MPVQISSEQIKDSNPWQKKWEREEKEKAKKKDTIVIIQYGTGKTIWLPQDKALHQIMIDFDYIEQIYYAEKG